MIAERFPELLQLSAKDQLQLATELYEQAQHDEDLFPVPESHRRILDERHRKYGDDPKPGRTWDEVKAAILKDR